MPISAHMLLRCCLWGGRSARLLGVALACWCLLLPGTVRSESSPVGSSPSGEDRVALKGKRKPARKKVKTKPASRAEVIAAERRRASILEQVRCAGEDPTTCFLSGSWALEEVDGDAVAPVSAQEIVVLLDEVLQGLEAHDGRRILQAVSEREEEQGEARAFFGAADHLLQPSSDIYVDPVKALKDRPPLYLDRVDPRDFDYPIVLNSRVQAWMVYFLTRGRKWFVKWLARAERYEPLIVPELKKAGLPQDLFYQAMIESGFNPFATSRAQAVGVWQFISSTGRAYGLERNWWIDERRDPELATAAAVQFLSELYDRFGAWELASAAYNAGGGKIGRAISMYGTNDYWQLIASHRSYLKPETKNYVPKVIAATVLAKYRDRYGLTEDIPEEHRLSPWGHEIVTVPEATDLNLVAKLSGVSLKELEFINPSLRRGYTPPGVQNYRLRLPLGTAKKFTRAFERLPAKDRVTFVRHRIRRGDTLGRIASRYKVPLSAVQKMNRIRNPRRLRVGQTLVIPVRASTLPSRTLVHVVDKGDNLSRIAARYEVDVKTLVALNGLDSDVLKVGQKLKVVTSSAEGKPADMRSAQASSAASGKVSENRRPTFYSVRKGDSLARIASKFRLSAEVLREINNLPRSGVIHPGDRLRLTAAPPPASTVGYVVKAGDTLSFVATKYGMSTRQLMELNRLGNDRIRVGQKLRVLATGTGGSPLVHSVEKGQTLYGIASRYRVSVDNLLSWNQLRSSNIRIGQQLTVYPGRSSPEADSGRERSIAYQVQSGDTLWAISRKYGVSVEDLKSWNDIRDDRVRPGQRIRVILR